MGEDATFNSLVGDLDYPMFIVTACADGERSGCLIGFATQASIDPPRFLVGLSHKNRTYRVGIKAELAGDLTNALLGARRDERGHDA
jgi:flavin reductase (DIM6/NTAB) family NADH-FMN oxidoreductase RutF